MRWRLSAAVLTALLCLASVAPAQMTGNVDQLKADLHGVDLDRAVAAASALGSLKDPRALDALLGALTLGAPPKLAIALIEALGQHKDRKALTLLRHYAGNRNVLIRGAAIQAVSSLAGVGLASSKEVVKILLDGLGDSNPMVRARSARLLGALRAVRAQKRLFKMLKKGDKSAAAPLGQVGGVEAARKLSDMIGTIDAAAIATALGEMLKRQDFGPDPLRLQVVKALGKISDTSATVALVEYIASVPAKDIRISKRIAEQLVAQRQD